MFTTFRQAVNIESCCPIREVRLRKRGMSGFFLEAGLLFHPKAGSHPEMSEPYPASSRCLGSFAGWVSPPRNLNQTSGIPPARGLNPFCESTKSGADLEQGAVGGAHGRIREGSRLPLQGADIVNFEEGEGLLAMQQWRWLDVDESLGEIGIRVEMLNLGGGGCCGGGIKAGLTCTDCWGG